MLPGALLVATFLTPCPAFAQSGDAPGRSSGEAATADGKVAPVTSKAPIPTQNLWSIVLDGGPLMIPIGICSLVLLSVVFERSISLRRGRIIPRPFVTRFLRQMRQRKLDREQALELCETDGSPVARVFTAAVQKWGRPAVEVEQAVLDAGERATNGLRRYLRVFNGVATISPLLGLLGTVVGMIRAFNAIATADAMGRPELLASGISQALLTTAAGLTVAIPALIFYLYFVSRVDRLIIDIDALGQQLVNLVSAEGLQSPEKQSRERHSPDEHGPEKKPHSAKARRAARRGNAA
jgi:biopolymer transport protein ExbB